MFSRFMRWITSKGRYHRQIDEDNEETMKQVDNKKKRGSKKSLLWKCLQSDSFDMNEEKEKRTQDWVELHFPEPPKIHSCSKCDRPLGGAENGDNELDLMIPSDCAQKIFHDLKKLYDYNCRWDTIKTVEINKDK